MAISFAEPRHAPLAEVDPAWIPARLLARRLPSAMEMLEEELARVASPGFGRSWSGYAAHRAAGDHRAHGEVSLCAISKQCAQRGDDGESLCSTRGPPSPQTASRALWASAPEEGHEYEFDQLDSPREPASTSIAGLSMEGHECEFVRLDSPHEPASISIAGFSMDTPAGGAAAPTAAEVTSAHAEAAARSAPPKQAPKLVTTLMIQNVRRSLKRDDFMFFIDEQGFAGKYDFVHVPKSFGTGRHNGAAFVNFMKPEDAKEFALSIARIKGSKMRAVPAVVQGLVKNAWKASSRRMSRIRNSDSRPWVAGGHGKDALLHA